MTAPIEDMVFAIRAMGAENPAGGWNIEEVTRVLAAYAGFVDTKVGPSNAPGDREGCRVENGRVRMPAQMPRLYREYVELGWHLLPLPANTGGVDAPDAVAAAASEMLSGASHAFQMLVGLVPGAVRVIDSFGTPEQKARLLPDLASGAALATMCLTESGAGSDLGAIRTRGARTDDGGWTLTGEKIFISGGDQDLSEKIIHLVLARTGSLEDGVRGLSLFACPSERLDGTRNAVRVLRIEEKLGLHASPTCQLRFDAAQAHLLGEPGDGLRAMFVMMDHARLDVALQGIAHAAHAHALAAEYAGIRVQGGAVIAEHADVRRMLWEMEALTLGGRAMAYRAAALSADADLAAFLTPVCKVFCSELSTNVADLGIQVLGGFGYLTEYGMEQIWRDARVTRIYEGTNGVLAKTLVKRLLRGKEGAHAAAFLREIDEASAAAASEEAREGLQAVRHAWLEASAAISGSATPELAAFALMQLTGLLFFCACWVRLEAAGDIAPDRGRVARLGRFVRAAHLPEAEALRIRCGTLATLGGNDG